MRRRQVIGLLSVTAGLSGCLRWLDEPEAFVDLIALENETGESVDLEVSISEAGSDVYTETISLAGSGRYGSRSIWEPVSDPGNYIIRVGHNDAATEINTTEKITPERPHMGAVIRLAEAVYFDADILTEEEKIESF